MSAKSPTVMEYKLTDVPVIYSVKMRKMTEEQKKEQMIGGKW